MHVQKNTLEVLTSVVVRIMQRKERQYPTIFISCFHGYVLKLLFFAVRIALCVKCLEREKDEQEETPTDHSCF